MHLVKATNLACPLDGLALEQSDKQLVCQNGHSFDIARQAYVNLLPAHHKASKNPGDNKEMVMARTAFLELGQYKPIADKLINLLTQIIVSTEEQSICILDAGCGEAYYLEQILNTFLNSNIDKNLSCIGIDISKPAIQAACRRSKHVSWLVASNKNIPVLADSVDIVLCMFGFPAYESFKRVLKHNGWLVLLDTGPQHLIELRQQIYPEIRDARPFDYSDIARAGFVREEQSEVNYSITLDTNEKIMQLLGMTPHLYRAPSKGIGRVKMLDEINLTVDVICRTFRLT